MSDRIRQREACKSDVVHYMWKYFATAKAISYEALSSAKVSLSEHISYGLVLDIDEFFLDLSIKLPARRLKSIALEFTEYLPSSWWQMFKQQHFPAFLLRRFRVKRRSVRFEHDVDIDVSFPQHLMKLEGKRGVIHCSIDRSPGDVVKREKIKIEKEPKGAGND